jgi:dsDNA-specific endonuclease/ATPase MutS2
MPIRDWIHRHFGGPWRATQAARPETADITDDAESDPFDPFPEPVRVEISDVFDLHAIAPRDCKRVVEEYLREAHRKGFRSVRIIHGKGAGVQREMVRSILGRTPFVQTWTDAPPEAGGWGATIAHLSPGEEAGDAGHEL